MSGIRFSSGSTESHRDAEGRRPDLDITPTLLAEQMGGAEKGWSRFRAYRKMLEIEAAFPGVVRRGKGRQLLASAKALAPHVEGMRESTSDREVRLLRLRVQELEARMDLEVKARLQFQSLAHAWFTERRLRAPKAVT